MDAQTRQSRGQSFDAVADAYERMRPSYPPDSIGHLIQRAALSEKSEVLEIGAGSGKATQPLVDLKCSLTCVEPGKALAQILRTRFGQAAIVVENTFEKFSAASNSFDAIVAAQAFHWLDPQTRFQSCHTLLRSGGTLCLLWNMSPKSSTPFFSELYEIYDRVALGLREPSFVDAAATSVKVPSGEEMLGSNLFENGRVDRVPWTASYSADEFLLLIDTFSNHRALDDATRAKLYAEIRKLCRQWNRPVEKEYCAILYTAKRRE
jgi:SAM-dependent methyltransferase